MQITGEKYVFYYLKYRCIIFLRIAHSTTQDAVMHRQELQNTFSLEGYRAMPPDLVDGTSKGFDHRAFIGKYSGATIAKYNDGDVVFRQGEPADAAFFIVSGNAKVTVVSEHGKEAVLDLLKAGDFFGEECLDASKRREATVTAASPCEIARFDYDTIARALREDPEFANLFLSYVLAENERLREELIDQLFNSSEKRLARVLLTLANFSRSDTSSVIAIPITQETLAHMVGTTRARINHFMTNFRKLGYVEYDGHIRVHNSLMKVIQGEQPDRPS